MKREFEDELTKINYTLSRKEQEIARLRFELEKTRQELDEKNRLLAQASQRLDNLAPNKSLVSSEKEETIRQQQEELEDEKRFLSGERERQDATQFTEKGAARNPTGAGGLPSSSHSSGVAINESHYLGPKVKLGAEPEEELTWDPTENKYKLAVSSDGLQYTFFSAEMAYLNPNYNCQQNTAYSANIFKKQVWYEKTPKGRYDDGIGALYKGKVPLKWFMDELASRLNPVLFLPSGGIIEKQDFRKAFANWRYKYQVGRFFKTREGELYSINEVDESRSQGNPPAYRTAGRDVPGKGVISGERVKTTNEERRQWLRNKRL